MEWNNKEFQAHDGMDKQGCVEKFSDTRFKRVSNPETKSNVELINLKMVLVNSPDEDIHDRIGTKECDKFGSSIRTDKKEEEKVSKAWEGRGISINIWNSKDQKT